ncbi:MAG: TnsA endonuclease N-terminal domain-containing protein [Aquabacterium sp.]|uniref:TnsA endonuclease N-terminal domain-containing protein n=1 Tax=Aquabacterium sp. TaxID=1872578 RepID=UPI0027211C14|nr:TnsA endonuclease N-terminal domain-containing protein [Aquabacterium sp.]MDO9006079.1 TnsA endonuclease N-terminal domain-containing protein [Aquabacterium sp.]
MDFKPVRKIGVQTRSMTGTMPDGNRYESALERDLMELLRADRDFKQFHAQPVKLSYFDEELNAQTTYTPDGLVFWKSDRKPWLVEVKYRADCVGMVKPFLRKFRAARAHAKEQGWEFKVLSEDRIRGQRLLNIRFLHRYKSYQAIPAIDQAVLAAVADGATTPTSILEHVASSGQQLDVAIGQIWRMVALEELQVDHQHKLTMNTRIGLGKSCV